MQWNIIQIPLQVRPSHSLSVDRDALQSLAQDRSNSFASTTLAECSSNSVAQLILKLAQIRVFGDNLGSQTL